MWSRLPAWVWIWFGWTALALFFAISLWLNYIAQGRPAHFRAALLVSLSEWWTWALLTPAVIAVTRRMPFRSSRLATDLAAHVVAAVVIAGTKVLAERLARQWLFGVAPYLLPSSLALHFLIYWAVAICTRATDYYRESQARALRTSQLEARLSEARLQVLQAQLRPHFLFNTLNTIAEMVHEDVERADRMIAGLAELLRASLEPDDIVTVADEVRLAQTYLDIQQARFGDRLHVEWNVNADCLSARLPRLLLQPLLENAVQHGLAPRAGRVTISVSVSRTRDRIELRVADDGAGYMADRPDGTGLNNTRGRLAAFAGDRATLLISRRPAGGTLVVLEWPVEAIA